MGRALVTFDFDGTLADSFVETLASYNRIAPRFHLRNVARGRAPFTSETPRPTSARRTTRAWPPWR